VDDFGAKPGFAKLAVPREGNVLPETDQHHLLLTQMETSLLLAVDDSM
jgi:hypothetical protein